MYTILTVEDDLHINNLLKEALGKAGYACSQAFSGTEALLWLEHNECQLILLDLMLPGLSGEEVLQQIRQTSNVPVIVLTAKGEMEEKLDLLTSGADDYMTKPFSPSELVARVKAHLERYKKLVGSAVKEENEVIEAGGLKIDRTARRVYVDGVEKNLTTKEFDLLFFLAQHPNRVFSKEELLEEVWQLSPVGADIATVTVHIKKIREKIEKDTQNPQYIETVWAVGYRFIVKETE